MRWVLALIALTALAGCLDSSGTGTDGPQPVAKVPVRGQVLTPALVPIEGAIVTLQNPGTVLDDGTKTLDLQFIEATADANGFFVVESFPGTHLLRVEHLSHAAHEQDVRVPGENLTIFLIPTAPDGPVPFQQEFPFDGYIECGLEALIISPSCDTATGFAGAPAVFQDDSVFEIDLESDWQTVVLDVHFDPADHPGIAGMRVSAYAPDADAEVFSYERIHQASGAGPFTLRLEPGVDYGDDLATPEGAGGLRFEFFPHGHGDDTVCVPEGVPEGDQCFLGAGTTQALDFEAIATVFYVEPAADGWTLLE